MGWSGWEEYKGRYVNTKEENGFVHTLMSFGHVNPDQNHVHTKFCMADNRYYVCSVKMGGRRIFSRRKFMDCLNEVYKEDFVKKLTIDEYLSD